MVIVILKWVCETYEPVLSLYPSVFHEYISPLLHHSALFHLKTFHVRYWFQGTMKKFVSGDLLTWIDWYFQLICGWKTQYWTEPSRKWMNALKWPAVCCIVFISLPLHANTPYLTAYITRALHSIRRHHKLVAIHYNLRIEKTGAMKIEVNVHETRSSSLYIQKGYICYKSLEGVCFLEIRTKDRLSFWKNLHIYTKIK